MRWTLALWPYCQRAPMKWPRRKRHPVVEFHRDHFGVQLSPAGKNDWGPSQTLNDKDKEVDHDEPAHDGGAGTL
jgi:hypothetical protein